MFHAAIEGSVRKRATTAMAYKVVVAIKAEKVISKAALAWALNHVVHPGDCITLLAVLPNEKTSNFFFFLLILSLNLCLLAS